MELNLRGKVALITGGSAGIGRAVAEELAQAQMRLALLARDADRLATVAEAIATRHGVEVLPIEGDVADPALPERAVARIERAFGRLDILVNNAGRTVPGGLMDASEAEWEEQTQVKLSALRRFCRAVVPGMCGRRWGRIVNISSVGGVNPDPLLLASHALSAAVHAFTRGLARELAPQGVLVNAVALGPVMTENWREHVLPAIRAARPELAHVSDDEATARLAAEFSPIGRFAAPEDVAALVAFLASGRNALITGAVIEAAGGADRFV